MRHFKRSALIGRPAGQVFGIIADVEKYPEFVPGCSAARVQFRDAAEVVAALDVRRGPLSTTFTTRNSLQPPHAIEMTLVEGPFRALQGRWSLLPLAVDGCRIELELQFEFLRAFPATLFDPVFEEIAAALVDAFVARARGLPLP